MGVAFPAIHPHMLPLAAGFKLAAVPALRAS
jgi:hypothetical protein